MSLNMVEHKLGNKQKVDNKGVLIGISLLCYLCTAGLAFFVFSKYAVPPLASAVLSLVAGGFVVFVVMGISGLLREFSIKSPLLELTSSLKERIEYVKEDLSESKKDINEKISNLNSTIQSISNRIDNMSLSMSNSDSRARSSSNAHLTSQVSTNTGEVVKEVGKFTMDLLELKSKERGYRWSTDDEYKMIKGRQERVEEMFKISSNGLDVQAIIDKGLLKSFEGKYSEAITIFDLVLEKDPANLNALNNKGNALSGLGRFEEAVMWLKKALEIDPHFFPALINTGNALLLQQKISRCHKLL